MRMLFEKNPYGCCFFLALLLGFGTAAGLLWRKKMPGNLIGYSVLLNLVCMLYGAKMYSIVLSGFRENLLTAGFSSLGGAIGLLAAVYVMSRICRLTEGKRHGGVLAEKAESCGSTENCASTEPAGRMGSALLECYAAIIPLLYGVAKTGCYFAGCCRGISYDGPLCVYYDNAYVQAGPCFPVQLLESVLFLLIFFVGLFLLESDKKAYFLSYEMMACACGKFFPDFLREEHGMRLLTPNQIVCLCFFVWGLCLFFKRKNLKIFGKRS